MEKRTGFWYKPLLLVLLSGLLALPGCSGDDGAPGAAGAPGADAPTLNEIDARIASVEPESCAICHDGNVVRSGQAHQDAYDELFQQGVVVVTNVQYTNGLGDADGDPLTADVQSDIVTFEMTKAGGDFICTDADALNIGFSQYTPGADAGTGTFTAPDSLTDGNPDGDRLNLKGTVTYDPTTNTCTSIKAETVLGDLAAVDGVIAVYGHDELVTSDPVAHLSLARFPYAAILETGAGVDYVSAANVTGCEKCHTTPYYKHGFITGDVGAGVGDLDFYTCKVCHIDNGAGGHTDWQRIVDDPQGWANDTALTLIQEARYAYTIRLMNDVHMSHAMEFPYPQSMANCATCHEGKLDVTLSDDNYTLETCKSCHPITGGTDTANADGDFAVDTRPLALETILFVNASYNHAGVDLDDPAQTCNLCHVDGGIARVFSEIHTGYNALIYADTTGTKYADVITASIDSATLTGTDLTISFSAAGTAGGLNATAIVPTVMVSFYGYDTKDFLVSCHSRDANGLRLEFALGAADNALFTTVDGDGTVDGTWEVTLHMAAYAPINPAILPSITDMIAAGTIKRAEIAVMPALQNTAGDTVGLNAPSRTFDLTTGAFVDNYFSGTEAIVSVETTTPGTKGCNSCHDQLATTFHSGNRGGNIVVCRMCHVVTNGGSHLQGQSRSIDSYVHAVHRFQAFDVEDVDFTDPVEAKHYEEHISFLFPDFATVNCMACHNAGKFDVPDQAESMPGLLSPTDEIPGISPATTPEVVTGPAARACGACHRAQFIKEDDAGGFTAFNQHTEDFGYRVENDADDRVLYGVIEKIMSMF